MNRLVFYGLVRKGLSVRLLAAVCCVLVFAMTSCAFPGLSTTSVQLPTVEHDQVTPELPPVRFPDDEGSHDYLTEWWYYTGHFEATDTTGQRRQCGFELVFFQASRSDLPLAFPAHFAISDLTREEFHYDQRLISKPREQVPDNQATQGIDLSVGDWSIQGQDGRDHLKATMSSYAIDIQLTGSKPPVLHNGQGLITSGLNGFSYYYSRTNMAITGTIVDHGQSFQVTGLGWMDHQWGNFLTSGQGGWDWYSLQFADHTELMLYTIHDTAGTVVATYGGYINASGESIVLPPDSFSLTAQEQWTSPPTGITYPSGWLFESKDKRFPASFTIEPALKDQELVVLETTGNIYWEGSVAIQGQKNGQPLTGRGYVELTGYAAT